jgi:hypothetical protein
MLERSIAQGHLEQLAACFFHCFLDGYRHFSRLALAHADATITIANDRKGRKTEYAATFYDFGDTVHRNHLLPQSVSAVVSLVLLPSCH